MFEMSCPHRRGAMPEWVSSNEWLGHVTEVDSNRF
jgi:hypothetical protein